MDKRLDFTGGNPDIRLDQITIDAEANRPAMFAMLNSLSVGTNQNFIIDGCVVTIGGDSEDTTYSITEGYVFINGEILKVDSQSGVYSSDTENLVYEKVVTFNPLGDVTYKDGTPRQTWQQNRAVASGSIAAIGATKLDAINGDKIDDKLKTYIGDASTTNKGVVEKATTTELQNGTADKFIDAALLTAKDGGLITKVIEIGDWDMTTDTNISVNHGVTNTKIREASVMIRRDDGTVLFPLVYNGAVGVADAGGGIYSITSSVVQMHRITGGFFDAAVFSSTSFNRGWLTIRYTP